MSVQHRLDVAGGGGGAVELVQLHAAACRDDAGHSGFANAGGAVEDHVGDLAAFDRAAENLIFAEKMLLSADFIQSCGGAGAVPMAPWWISFTYYKFS